jgi:putative FmdB family regulatory protein
MPIFEYRCQSCGHQFEHITRGDARPSCPECHGDQLEKMLSVFAVGAGASIGKIPSDGPCATCGIPGGPGACGMAGRH